MAEQQHPPYQHTSEEKKQMLRFRRDETINKIDSRIRRNERQKTMLIATTDNDAKVNELMQYIEDLCNWIDCDIEKQTLPDEPE